MADDKDTPYRRTPYRPRVPAREPVIPEAEEFDDAIGEAIDDAEELEPEQRVAITLSVGDGFKFGCGLLLAMVAFYFALIIVIGAALLTASILGIPLPFGIGR